MITYKIGDLLDANEIVIAHGVNSAGKFGAGVAKAIANRFPEAKKAYLEKHYGEGWKLADIQVIRINGFRYICNICTQEWYGYYGCYVNYEAVDLGFDRLFAGMRTMNLRSIAIPRIGAGLGGGDWTMIEGIIQRRSDEYGIDVWVYYLE